MYYVVAVSRNYNIVISIRAGAPGGQSAAFTTRLETCRGPIQTIDCNITIDFEWSTAGAGSGTGQVTIFSGTSGNSTIPAPGNALTYIGITNISSDCTNYNNIQACPPFDSSTTTTTTTSTTTTTTTIAPAQYSDAAIKHDQVSGSFNFGTNTWTNLGVSGSIYNLEKTPVNEVTINSGGSGTGAFLGMTSSLNSGNAYYYCLQLTGRNFINLSDMSFSYGIVFRLESTSNFDSTRSYSITTIENTGGLFSAGFRFIAFLNEDNATISLYPSLYRVGTNTVSPTIIIPNTPKWYFCVITFDKTQDSNNAANFYINGTKIPNLYSGDFSIASPSTFFQNNAPYGTYYLAANLNPIKIAASIFWQNTALNANQIQNLTNEYNSRYTLG